MVQPTAKRLLLPVVVPLGEYYSGKRKLIITGEKNVWPAAGRNTATITADIQHVAGNQNVAADALSRVATISTPTSMDYGELARAQATDAELAQALREVVSASRFGRVRLHSTENEVYSDVSTGKPRPYLPLVFVKKAFDTAHRLSHPGVRASRLLVKGTFYWPLMKRSGNLGCHPMTALTRSLGEVAKFSRCSYRSSRHKYPSTDSNPRIL